jgi:hypothetical protein
MSWPASTLHGDIEGADLDISRPKSVSIRASCLENALTGRRWTRPAHEKFLDTRNDQQIRGLEAWIKKRRCNAVHNDVLRELILRTTMPTRTTCRGSDNGGYVNFATLDLAGLAALGPRKPADVLPESSLGASCWAFVQPSGLLRKPGREFLLQPRLLRVRALAPAGLRAGGGRRIAWALDLLVFA